jgi:uncharacterized membrane protein
MRADGAGVGSVLVAIILICVVLPAVLSYAAYAAMRARGWIKDGDMRLGS